MNIETFTNTPPTTNLRHRMPFDDRRRAGAASRPPMLPAIPFVFFLALLFVPFRPLFAQRIISFDQASNGRANAPSSPMEWQSGALHSGNSHYGGNMTVPYRMVLTDLNAGQLYCVTIGWTTKYNGKHTFDALTSYERDYAHQSAFDHPLEVIDPLLGTPLEGRFMNPQRFPLISPSTNGSPVAGQPQGMFSAFPATDRRLAIFNGSISTIRYVRQDPLNRDDAESQLEICFYVNPGERTVVLAWGAHIASESVWRAGNTAIGENGTPYRMYVADCSGLQGCGQRTLNMRAAGLFSDTSCGVSGPAAVCGGSEAIFTGVLNAAIVVGQTNLRYSWRLFDNQTGASFIGSRNGRTVRVNPGNGPGYFSIELSVNGLFVCSQRIYVHEPENVALEPSYLEWCALPSDASLRWVGIPDDVTAFTRTLVLRDPGGAVLAEGATLADLLPALPGISGAYTITGVIYPETDPSCQVETAPVTLIYDANEIRADFAAEAVCLGQLTPFSDQSVTAYRKGGWQWSFGDGATSTQQNPRHRYAAPGRYNVRLILLTEGGCRDTIEKEVRVYDVPEAGFSADPACEGTDVAFRQTARPGEAPINTYNWRFGDGAGSTAADPTHRYAQSGNYPVRLIVADELGCRDTVERPLRIYDAPEAGFTAPDVCLGSPVSFQQTSRRGDAALATYAWRFGDGQQSPAAAPQHLYQQPGTYSVTLTVTDANGCSDDVTGSVRVFAPVEAAAGPDQSVCAGGEAVLQGAVRGDVTTGRWSDGGAGGVFTPGATTLNATYTPPAGFTGVITLTLTSADPTGPCPADSDVMRLTVRPLPTVAFQTGPVCAGEAMTFRHTSTSANGEITSVRWAFGDGAGSTAARPSHTYAGPGTYQVTLTVTDAAGCSRSLTQPVVVNARPVVNFDVAGACPGEPWTFTNRSQVGAGLSARYRWSFGDGGTSTDENPTHAFASGGIYSVSLEVTDGNGCSNTRVKDIVVRAKPTAAFRADPVCAGEEVAFTNTSTTVAGRRLTAFEWAFGDGATSTDRDPRHRYAGPGSYAVTLTVTDDDGCRASVTRTVVVRTPPTAAFTVADGCAGNPTSFVNNSTAGGAPLRTYAWTFGDGAGSTAAQPGHTYAAPGAYRVTLTVTDANGCTATTERSVTIRPTPQAAFRADEVCTGTPTSFIDESTVTGAAITGWQWAFGDGNGSTQANPSHTYARPGTYRARLTVTTADGCPATVVQDVVVLAPPTPAFTAENLCFGETVRFTNQTAAGGNAAIIYEWAFGDGNGSLLPEPAHTYAQPGRYTVVLTATDGNGCGGRIEKEIVIHAPPKAAFTAPPVCQGAPVVFTSTSQPGDGAITTYQWAFGDGRTGSGASPTVTFTKDGIYTVRLTVADANGCDSEAEAQVRVFPAVQVEAGANLSVCAGGGAVALSGAVIGGATGGRWSDGDRGGVFSPAATALNATYTPPANYVGPIVLTLTSDDPEGPCGPVSDALTLTVGRPAEVAAGDDAVICAGAALSLRGIVIGGASGGRWSDGGRGGAFTPSATALAATYTPPANFSGQITLTLTSDDPAGPCEAVSDALIVAVRPAVVVAAGADRGICLGDAVDLQGAISGGASGGRWSDGGRGGAFTPSATALAATYTPPANFSGQITLTLTSDDPEGPCGPVSDALILTVRQRPKVSFQADPVCDRQAMQFVNTSSAGSGGISGVRWAFGDGAVSTEAAPSHVYDAPGKYQVTLTVTDAGGCTASATQEVEVKPRPVAGFTVVGNCPGQSLAFQNNSQVTPGETAAWAWEFGDGATSTERDPSHTYATPGSYTVRLRVTTGNGCFSTMSREVNVRSLPKVSFTAAPVCEGGEVVFVNTSTGVNAALTGYRWEFGDGATSTQANPRHTYAAAGRYTVTLSVTDNFGCTASATQPVEVFAPPVAAFSTSGACEDAAVTFTSTSRPGSAAITALFWEFGDGSTSTQAAPQYTFTDIGTYTVRLTVTDANGCKGTVEQTVRIGAPPAAAFRADPVCEGGAMTFVDQSTAGGAAIERRLWQFGDGATSEAANPTHTYGAPGTYRVVLTVFDAQGCQASRAQDVVVRAAPQVDFTARVDCDTRVATFADRSQGGDGAITAYAWAFGDGAASTQANPSHTYAAPGTYVVTLEVTNERGCRRRIERQVVVPAAPTAAFTVSGGCTADGADVVITNQSQPAPGGPATLSYLWIVRDSRGREAGRSQQATPGFDLPADTYTIELTVGDGGGCEGRTTRTVTVYPDPAITLSAAADRVCLGEGLLLTAAVSGGANCGNVEWQRAQSPTGPWNIISGAGGLTYTTRSDLAAGRYYYRARYRCETANCDIATSNVLTVDIGAGQPNLACNALINVPLGENCRAVITPAMVADGAFGFCFPYRAEDFEVIVYDARYPNGGPDNVVETWGLFSYTIQLKEAARQAGGVFEPCWGQIQVNDQTPPAVTCPADVTGLLRAGNDHRPAFQASDAVAGETFQALICGDLDSIYRTERSWTDPSYRYFTGRPQVVDACGAATLVKVDDRLIQEGCTPASLAFGGQVSTRLVRTFTYEDQSGNRRSCDQTIYFFRPRVLLPDCEVSLDLCAYGSDTQLLPATIGSSPYYLNGAGDTLRLLDFVCGMSVIYQDQRFPGPPNCGFQVVRTWTFLDECRGAGLAIDLIDLPLTARGCVAEPAWSGARLTFEQRIEVADKRPPVVDCPAPPAGSDIRVFSTGPFNCTAVINPPAPVVTGECQNWTWTFEVYGIVVDPRTQIPQYKLIGTAQNQLLAGVPTGDYDLVYIVTDACGNTTRSGNCPIRVADRIDPVAICDGELRVSLAGNSGDGRGVAQVLAEDVSESSRDNCGEVELHVRRVIEEVCLDTYVSSVIDAGLSFAALRRQTAGNHVEFYNGSTLVITLEGGVYRSAWGRAVYFTCCDVRPADGERVTVELRVTDKAGNRNFCTSKVLVEDKLPPSCSVDDLVIKCTELDFDPRDSAQVAARFGAPGDVVTVFDNCGTTITERIIWTPANCGRGVLERVFTVTDASGLQSFCTQTITVENVIDYTVTLPSDASSVTCGEAGNNPISFETFGCDLIAINRDTARFDPLAGACHRLMITYDIINWCEYTGLGNTTPTRIPRDIDNDNDLQEPTWLVVAFDSTLNAIVAKVYGADAQGRRLDMPSRVFRPGDTGYNPGFFRYIQFVDIVDNTGPSIVVETAERSFCAPNDPAAGCLSPFAFRLRVRDDCALNTTQLGEAVLRRGGPAGEVIPAGSGAYRVSQSGSLYTVDGTLGLGSYHLVVRFTDGCGNISGQTIEFEIVDCQAPAPICKEILTADLLPVDTDGNGRIDGGQVIIPATAFIASNIQDCSPFPDEPVRQVKYYLSRLEPLTINDLTQQSMTFTCADEGLVDVYVIALDAAGNFDYCLTRVFVNPGNDPNPCDIPVGNGAIGGMIRTEDLDPVEEVLVRLSGQASGSVMTDAGGMYNFTALEEGYDYTVAPYLNRDFVNGVTTFDLLLISKHILAEDRLDSPYQMIAADANNDKRITTFDLIQFRKLILTLTTELEGNTSWRFVEGKYRFPDPANPWSRSFPEVININDLLRIRDDGDFVAVKIGDINGNARTSKLLEPEVRATAGALALRTADARLRAGQTYTIALRPDDLDPVEGFQFSLTWDRHAVELIDLEEGLLRAGELGLFPGEGTLTASWVRPPAAVASDSALFRLVLRATREVALRDVLAVNSRRTAAEAYDLHGELLGVVLAFDEEHPGAGRFALHPARPNPWREQTLIRFELPAAGEATLRIVDVNGRQLQTIRGRFDQGLNEVRLRRGLLPAGVLYCVLETAGHTAVEKMVVLE